MSWNGSSNNHCHQKSGPVGTLPFPSSPPPKKKLQDGVDTYGWYVPGPCTLAAEPCTMLNLAPQIWDHMVAPGLCAGLDLGCGARASVQDWTHHMTPKLLQMDQALPHLFQHFYGCFMLCYMASTGTAGLGQCMAPSPNMQPSPTPWPPALETPDVYFKVRHIYLGTSKNRVILRVVL